MSKIDKAVQAIYGHEPLREKEYPFAYEVGKLVAMPVGNCVERIEFREDNYGDHGLGWFDVWLEDGNLLASVNVQAVAEVRYQ